MGDARLTQLPTPTHLQRDGSRVVLEASQRVAPSRLRVLAAAPSRLRVVAVAQGQRAKRRDLGATEAPLLQSRI